MEVVGFDVDCRFELAGAQLVVGDEGAQDTKPRRVADRLLHGEVLLERKPAFLGERGLRLVDLI